MRNPGWSTRGIITGTDSDLVLLDPCRWLTYTFRMGKIEYELYSGWGIYLASMRLYSFKYTVSWHGFLPEDSWHMRSYADQPSVSRRNSD